MADKEVDKVFIKLVGTTGHRMLEGQRALDFMKEVLDINKSTKDGGPAQKFIIVDNPDENRRDMIATSQIIWIDVAYKS